MNRNPHYQVFKFQLGKKKYSILCFVFSPILHDGMLSTSFQKLSRSQKAPDKNVPQKEANVFPFFNITFKSATFSLLLNRFLIFSSPEGAAQPSQLALAKLLLLPAALRCSAAAAAPSLSPEYPPDTHTTSTWTEGIGKTAARASFLSASALQCQNPSPHQCAGC